MIIIWICLFFNLNWAAESDFTIEGEGRFMSEEGDSLPFIKEQLLFSSFQDVITKYLKKQELKPDLFWEKHEQRFEAFFKPVEAELRNKLSSDPKIAEEPGKINKEIRIKKLERKSQFGLLNRAVKSYSIVSMTRAQNMPKARYITISAQVDSNLVNQIYFEYVSPKKVIKGLNLYILPIFTLSNMSWTEIGVSSSKDFSFAVLEHWKKYLENGLSQQITDIILLGEDSQSDLRRAIESKQDKRGFLELGEIGGRNFSEGFLLLVKVQLKKISEKILLKKNQMEISLNFSLVDMRNDRIISYGDIPKSRFSINTEEVNQLSSSMATSVYRVPLEDFGRIKKDLVGYLGYSNLIYLTVNNIKSVEDLFNLSNTLKMKGVTYQVNPRIFSLSPNKGVLQLEFSGTQAEAEQFLRGMAKEKFLDGRNFIFEEDNGDYSLAIKSSGVKKAEDDQGESLENKKRVVL